MRLRWGGLALLFVCTAGTPLVQAQDFGVMAGGAFSKFTGDDKAEFTKTRVGLAGGVFASFALGRMFAFEPGVLFVQKGGKAEIGGATGSANLSYLEFPLLLKLRIPAAGNGRQLSPHLYAGGAVAFKLSCTIKSSGGIGGSTSDPCRDIGDDAKGTDLSAVFGAGIDVGRAMLGARWDLGLSKIPDTSPAEEVRNSTFYLLVGWTFRPPR